MTLETIEIIMDEIEPSLQRHIKTLGGPVVGVLTDKLHFSRHDKDGSSIIEVKARLDEGKFFLLIYFLAGELLNASHFHPNGFDTLSFEEL